MFPKRYEVNGVVGGVGGGGGELITDNRTLCAGNRLRNMEIYKRQNFLFQKENP